MKKKLALLVTASLGLMLLTGCESLERTSKSLKSEFGGGLERTVTVFSETGDVIFHDEGKFDVAVSEKRIKYIDENGELVIFYLGNSSSALVQEKGVGSDDVE